jgi:dTMP kinase
MKGKFIVIEGTDGSGKSVQTQLFKEFLKKHDIALKTDDYPRYETSVWGKLVGRMLTGEFGDLFNISPYLAVLPYMIDEYWGSKQIKKWVNKGKFVISNRYFTSNVHQVAKLTGEEQNKYRDWLWKTGWEEMKILKPDLVIVLLVDPEVSKDLIKKKGERNYIGGKGEDMAEKNLDHQRATYEEYQRMIKADKTWVAIDCCDENGLMSPETIHQMVIDKIKNLELLDEILGVENHRNK